MVRWESNLAGDEGFGFLAPGGVDADWSHYGAALLPVGWLQLFDELNRALGGGLLDAERATVGEDTIDSGGTVAVTEFGIEGDGFVQGGFEVGKVYPGQFEFDFCA